jgi:uncharacterized protein (DUF885 family)
MTNRNWRTAVWFAAIVLGARCLWPAATAAQDAPDATPREIYDRGGEARPDTTAAAQLAAGRASREHDRLAGFVRRFIDTYAARNPTEATQLGLHEHDAALDDRSAEANYAWRMELTAFREALTGIRVEHLDSADVIDMRVFQHVIDRELFRVADLRVWERNPIAYNDLLSNSLYVLAVGEFAPAAQRLERIVARERRFPALVAAARANLADPPELFTRKAIELAHGTLELIEKDLPAFASQVDDAALTAAFRESNATAAAAVREFIAFLETDLLPRSRGAIALGADLYGRMLTDGADVRVHPDEILSLGEQELARQLEELERVARSVPGKGKAAERYAAMSALHPPAESLLVAAEATLAEIAAFVEREGIVALPAGERCEVLPMPPFAWGFAAMLTPGVFETAPVPSRYFVKTVDPSWDETRREQHLRLFSPWDLTLFSIHEVYPGHFVQQHACRRAASPIRQFAGDYAFTEGWAHYCEQMLLDAGFGDGEPRYRLAAIRASLLRLCRLIVSIRVHTQGMPLEDATRFFQKNALLEEGPARQEAERTAFDPECLHYALGKLAIQKMREDWRAARGDAFSEREFHDRLLSYGSLPLRIVREAMLGAAAGPIL